MEVAIELYRSRQSFNPFSYADCCTTPLYNVTKATRKCGVFEAHRVKELRLNVWLTPVWLYIAYKVFDFSHR